MSSQFQLHASDAANYRWGSLLVRFSPYASLTTKYWLQNLSGLCLGRSVWNTGSEFRQTVASLHEITHYLQDCLTGIGHWDYLMQRKWIPEQLSCSRYLSFMPWASPPFSKLGTEVENSFLRECLVSPHRVTEDSVMDYVFVPSSKLPLYRRTEFLRSLATTGATISPGDEEAFFIENMLEAEAAATVLLQFRALEGTERQREIMELHRSLFDPNYMESFYTKTLSAFYYLVEHMVGDVDPDASVSTTDSLVIIAYRLLIYLVDLACAHPSPRLLASNGASKSDYEPGLRCVRLVHALQRLPSHEIGRFIEAVLRNESNQAEQCLRVSDIGYLPSETIYKDWHDLFSEMLKQDDDHILRIRRECCERRLSNPNICISKVPLLLVDNQVPFFFLSQEGIQGFGSSYSFLNPDERKILLADLMRHDRDLALVEHFLESGRFVCNQAEGNICSGATRTCISGITKNSQFPETPECHVRNALENVGFMLVDHSNKEDIEDDHK